MEIAHAGGGKVVSLFNGAVAGLQRGGAMGMGVGAAFPAIAQVDGYWDGLRAGRLMPNRSEVDPRGLEGALEYAFILEYIARGVGRLRVAGMHLNDLMGMEVRGMPLSAFFAPQSRIRFSGVLETVVTEPKVADLTLTAERGIGRPPLTARLYLAPLGNDGTGAPRVLGCLQSDGSVGRTPRRFSVEQVHLRRIIATAGPVPETAPFPAPERTPQPVAFAEPTTRYVQPKPGRPKLRLVKSDD